MARLFALTLFVGASLLFVVQPMIGKLMLPLLGGSPAVWNTCMVFFQAALLAGYAYAHFSTTWLGSRRGLLVHACLMLLAGAFLPLAGPTSYALLSGQNADRPGLWLLGQLLSTVGLPFFIVATTAPLLQRWFSLTDHPTARDPYFLYGASNLGSMLALLGYPLIVEPTLSLAAQGESWSVGYGLLVALVLVCGTLAARSSRGDPATSAPGSDDSSTREGSDRPGVRQWSEWVTLSFIPSSLLLGLTSYLTVDLAPLPLLWVIPLALYLLTFILVFARHPVIPAAWLIRLLPPMIVLLTVLIALKTHQAIFVPVHLVGFFVAAMVCHGELVRRRPAPARLTEFYLAMSVGGVLGGGFNAMVAPHVFNWVAEYPLGLVLAGLVGASLRGGWRGRRITARDLLIPLALGGLLAWLSPRLLAQLGSGPGRLWLNLAYGLAGFVCYSFADRPARFAVGLAAVLLVSQLAVNYDGRVVHQERNFFGVLRVAETADGKYRRLIHGGTLHGQQSLDPGRRREPLSYYHRTGPIGQVFEVWAASGAKPARVAGVGLGTGSLACYATPVQEWTFYEINPAVVRIAGDPRYFTFLNDCEARSSRIELGDARLRLREAPAASIGLMVLDAFSSDAIPMHLLTREALALYRDKLAEGGLIAFHISNRYIDLAPVLSALARDAGMVVRVRDDTQLPATELSTGKSGSIWAVMADAEKDLGPLASDPRWREPAVSAAERAWTDDFSNIVKHLILTGR